MLKVQIEAYVYKPEDHEVFLETTDCDYDPMIYVVSRDFYEKYEKEIADLENRFGTPHTVVNEVPENSSFVMQEQAEHGLLGEINRED